MGDFSKGEVCEKSTIFFGGYDSPYHRVRLQSQVRSVFGFSVSG